MMKSLVAASLLFAGAAVAQQSTTVTSTTTASASSLINNSSNSSTGTGTINNLLQSQNSTTLSTATLTNIGPAQTTVSLFNACSGSPAECNYNGLTYYGGVVSANPTATVFAVGCASSNNSTACGDQAITLTQGPSVYQRVETQSSPSLIISASCTIVDSIVQAVCVEATTFSPQSVGTVTAASAFAIATGYAVGFNANSVNGTQASATTRTLSFSSDSIFYNPLIITSGIEKLQTSATNTPISATGSFSVIRYPCRIESLTAQ